VNCSLWRASNDTFFDSERIELIDDPYHHQIVAAVKNRRIFQGKVKSPRVLDEESSILAESPTVLSILMFQVDLE
jgi:hypothetical protein